MPFRVLGPVEVVVGGRRLEMGIERRRAILAALLAARRQVVAATRLAEAVWGPEPPPSFEGTLRSHVSRLRGTLAQHAAGAAAVETEPGGYRLDIGAGGVDAERFADLVAEARRVGASDPAAAVAGYAEAEGLWRGAAFGDLADREIVRAEAVRLEALRASAATERVEAQLALGHHEAVIGELEAWVASEPLAEHVHGQLMRALYRSGRQADALAVYRRLQERLRDELGVDPSPPVQVLHEQMLRKDPELEAPRQPRRTEDARPAGGGAVASVPAESLAPLFGRDEDVGWVAGLLAEARLVTLTGPGGVGKTRLAERVGEVAAERFDDGVVWVGLASVSDAGSVGAALLNALDVPQQVGGSVEETLVAAVGTRRLLVVLDCCEHVLGAVAALVATVLGGCTNAAVLATSREPLRLSGERVWRVPPLRVPGTDADTDEVAEAPAVALFCARAAAAESSFALTDGNATVVAELCRRLDGVPLAIELAAARVRAMAPVDLLARLSDRFELLTGGPPHEAGRHRTLEAVVAWSHDLLDEREARLFERLSVFAGSFTLEAAEQVCAGDELAAGEVAGVLAELVDKSMVTVERTGEAVRYRLLDTLRAYGAARLAETGTADAVRDAHAAYHVALAEELGPRLRSPDEKAALSAIHAAFDDLRLAQQRLLDTGEVDGALRLPGALNDYLLYRLRVEVADWAERALALPGAREHPLHALGLATALWGIALRGDTDRARRYAEAVLERPENDLAAYYALGALRADAMQSGRLDALSALAERSEAVVDALGEPYLRASLAWQDVLAHLYAGHHEEARARLPRLEAAAEASGNPTVMGHLHYVRGELLAETDPQEAAAHLETAVEITRDVDDHLTSGAALVALASLRDRQGDSERSLAVFREAIGHWRRLGVDPSQLTALRNLVVALARVGADQAAARLHGAVTTPAQKPSFGSEAEKLAAAWDRLSERMGTDAAEAAASEGRRLSEAEAADEALVVLDDLLGH